MKEKTKNLLLLIRSKVESSHIAAVGHDGQRTMVVEFKNGVIWSYHPVTLEAKETMVRAESIGKWFNENVKKNSSITAEELSI